MNSVAVGEVPVSCPWFPTCPGCHFIGEAPSIQRERMRTLVESALQAAGVSAPVIEILQPYSVGHRVRLDFALENGRLGLRRGREVVDLPSCAHLTPELAAWLEDVRTNLPPLPRASVRLRVAPSGQRGMWIDAAGVDIKNLLDQQTWLRSWPADVVIELGQRRKTVDRSGSARPKLVDPEFHPWFRTLHGTSEVDLYGSVGGFTQPSLMFNKHIAEWFQRRVKERNPKRVIEFGSGNGNLSFPILAAGADLIACEADENLTKGFRLSLEKQGLMDRVRFVIGDHQRKRLLEDLSAEIAVVNPPRSGLGQFVDAVSGAPEILYMSCYIESFIRDLKELSDKGYRLHELTVLDQFPQTPHMEILARIGRRTT